MAAMAKLSILGTGSALPTRTVSNNELERLTGVSAGRIQELFEIVERRWSRGIDAPDPPEGQRCSDLAVAALTKAFESAGISASDVGALIAVTTTPDFLNPPIDSIIAQRLGLHRIPSFSLQSPCTGFFRAAALASALSSDLGGRAIAIVAADTPSPFFRFGGEMPVDQMLNSLLYADGAAAVVVGTSTSSRGATIETIQLALNTDNAPAGITFPGMLSAMPPSAERHAGTDYMGHHDFRRVLRRGSKLAASAALGVMERLGVGVGDVRFFLTHQATGNIRRIASSYGLPAEKMPINIDRVGNTISASVLILLDELARSGTLNDGDLLVLHTAESSTWSSAGMAIRWRSAVADK
jgi:3-oxoacyl-[acyl-carrier-protein] synthase III